MQPKAIIFDLDGTLLDTLRDLTLSTNAALAAFSLPPRTEEEVRAFVGNGVEKLMERAVPAGRANPSFAPCLDYFRTHYKVHCLDHTAPYPGVPEVLERLQKASIRTAIVSNKFDAAVKELAAHYFGSLIDLAVGESAAVRKKPAPDAVLAVMRALSVSPAECVYVGDSDVDVETGRNAGVRTIGVLWGFRDEACLRRAGGTELAHAPHDLLPLLSLSGDAAE